MSRIENQNGNYFRVTLTYIDGQGYTEEVSTFLIIDDTQPRVIDDAVPTEPLLWTRGQAIPPIDLSEWFKDDDGNDNQPLSYTETGLPAGVTISTGMLMGAPTTSTVASTSTEMVAVVTVTATDNDGGTATATFSYLINAETTATLAILFLNEAMRETTNTVPYALNVNITGEMDDNGLTTTQTYQWKLAGEAIASTTTDILILSATTAGLVYSVDVGFTDNLGLTTTLTAMTTIPAIITLVSTPTESVNESGQRVVTLSLKGDNVSPDQLVDSPWGDGGVAELAGVDENSIATFEVTFPPSGSEQAQSMSVKLPEGLMGPDGNLITFTIKDPPAKGIRLRAKVFLEGPLQ